MEEKNRNLTRVLYHFPLCPYSRTARLALNEKGLPHDLILEKTWEERPAFVDLNPAVTLPVLVEDAGLCVPGLFPLVEYLEEVYPEHRRLYSSSPATRIEERRLLSWINEKFFREVTEKLVWEKVIKRYTQKGWADSKVLREGTINLGHHMQYFAWLLETRDWLAGSTLSIADLALAAHLSTIDFIGYVPWEKAPAIKNWYACLKSRPSFRPLLGDKITGITPPAHYVNLDF